MKGSDYADQFHNEVRRIAHEFGLQAHPLSRTNDDSIDVIGRVRLTSRIYPTPVRLEVSEVPVLHWGVSPKYMPSFDICWDVADTGNPEDPPPDTDPVASFEFLSAAIDNLIIRALEYEFNQRRTR